MINTSGIERAAPSDYTVNLVPLFKQKLREIGAVLAGNPRN